MTSPTALTRIAPTSLDELKIEARVRQMINESLPLLYSFNTTNVEKLKQMIARFAEAVSQEAVAVERNRCARAARKKGWILYFADIDAAESSGDDDYGFTSPYQVGHEIETAILSGVTAEQIQKAYDDSISNVATDEESAGPESAG